MEDSIDPVAEVKGAGDAWSRVLQEHSPALRGWFAKRLRNRGDVDDAMQDLWLRICTRTTTDEILHARSYLLQVAQSVLVDRSRRAKVRHHDQHDELTEVHHPVEGITPDRVLLGKEALSRMVSNIHALPDRTRDIFVLHRFEGLPHGAIAQSLGISVSAVEKHIMKALRLLMQEEQDADV